MKRLFVLIIAFIMLTGCLPPRHKYVPFMEGDCVDRVVVLRQDLKKQGYEAQLVIGTILVNGEKKGHAWVKYKDKKTGEWVNLYNFD